MDTTMVYLDFLSILRAWQKGKVGGDGAGRREERIRKIGWKKGQMMRKIGWERGERIRKIRLKRRDGVKEWK
jgi:hypothetical protein